MKTLLLVNIPLNAWILWQLFSGLKFGPNFAGEWQASGIFLMSSLTCLWIIHFGFLCILARKYREGKI